MVFIEGVSVDVSPLVGFDVWVCSPVGEGEERVIGEAVESEAVDLGLERGGWLQAESRKRTHVKANTLEGKRMVKNQGFILYRAERL
jgi:hypothetical protein